MARINDELLNLVNRPRLRVPVIYQPIIRNQIADTSENPDTSVFRNSGVGLSDADKDQIENDKIKKLSTIGGGGEGEGEGGGKGDGADSGKVDKGGGDSSEDGFSIEKILKIVPIGINVLAKGPTLASGFADLVQGTAIGLVNVSLSSLDLFLSTFSFSLQGFKFMFILLICMVENMSNMNVCIVFYILDVIVLTIFLFIFSVLKLFDEALMIRLTGVSVVELVMMVYEPVVMLDDYIHSISGYHFIHYPDYITNKCYTCSVKLNTERTVETGTRLVDVLTGVIPRRMGEPIDKVISAFSKFVSIFDL